MSKTRVLIAGRLGPGVPNAAAVADDVLAAIMRAGFQLYGQEGKWVRPVPLEVMAQYELPQVAPGQYEAELKRWLEQAVVHWVYQHAKYKGNLKMM